MTEVEQAAMLDCHALRPPSGAGGVDDIGELVRFDGRQRLGRRARLPANRLIDQHRPRTLVLCAGATPRMAPLQNQTWESFSENWNVDVAQAFYWIRHALKRPLDPGTSVIVFSSGAAINGSPASGGYAGAKATQRFIAAYAQDESRRAGLDITVTAVMPRMTAFGDVGRRGIRAYAARSGQTEEAYLTQLGQLLTPEEAGSALLELVSADPASIAPGYLLTGAGLQQLP